MLTPQKILLSLLALTTPLSAMDYRGGAGGPGEEPTSKTPSRAASAPLYTDECRTLLDILTKATLRYASSENVGLLANLENLEQEVLLPLKEQFDIFSYPLPVRCPTLNDDDQEIKFNENDLRKIKKAENLIHQYRTFPAHLLNQEEGLTKLGFTAQWDVLISYARLMSEALYLERTTCSLKEGLAQYETAQNAEDTTSLKKALYAPPSTFCLPREFAQARDIYRSPERLTKQRD